MNDVARSAHGSGNDAEYAGACRRGALAMHDDITFRAVEEAMPFAPGEVVVVLEIETHVHAERARDVPVYDLVIGRGVPAHQLHRLPVVLAFVG